MYDYMGFGGMGGYMGFFWLIPLILIIWAAVVVLDSRKEQGKSEQVKSALDILQERYARGEINKQEYEEKQRGLQV